MKTKSARRSAKKFHADARASELHAPTPYELAALAIRLSAANLVPGEPNTTTAPGNLNPKVAPGGPNTTSAPLNVNTRRKAISEAAAWWAEARAQIDRIEKAEIYREHAVAAESECQARGDISEAEVQRMVSISTTSYFRKRAREFLDLDWKKLARRALNSGSIKDQPLRYLGGYAAQKATLAFNAGLVGTHGKHTEGQEPRWHRLIAEAFVVWSEKTTSENNVRPRKHDSPPHLQKALRAIPPPSPEIRRRYWSRLETSHACRAKSHQIT